MIANGYERLAFRSLEYEIIEGLDVIRFGCIENLFLTKIFFKFFKFLWLRFENRNNFFLLTCKQAASDSHPCSHGYGGKSPLARLTSREFPFIHLIFNLSLFCGCCCIDSICCLWVETFCSQPAYTATVARTDIIKIMFFKKRIEKLP